MSGLLLDTHAAIWLVEDRLDARMLDILVESALNAAVYVSPVTAWEIGLLSRSHKRDAPRFLPNPEAWVAELMTKPIVTPAPLTAAMAVASSRLPEPLDDDPADRLLISTARALRATLVTRDRKILDYGAAGHVLAMPC